MIIRGLVYSAEIPVIFNSSLPLDGFRYLPNVPAALRETLDQSERAEINTKYNALFIQGSHLAMAWLASHLRPRSRLARQLLDAGRADLRMACECSLDRNPGSVLFVAQQGPEKYLKALLVVDDPALTDDQLRKDYNHKMLAILEACIRIEPRLERYRNRIELLNFGPQVRYQSSPITPQKAVEIIDLAHDISHTVALHLLSRRRP